MENLQAQEKTERIISARREAWNLSACAALMAEGLDVQAYQGAIVRGHLEHHAVYVDGVYTYCLILRLDEHFDGSRSLSGVNVIAVSRSRASIKEAVLPYMMALAKAAGCKDVRVYADRPALAHIYEGAGFEAVETIYRREAL